MSNAASYSQAAYPEPYTILGIRLKPLSLQHYHLMARHSVAFVSDGPSEATFADLLLGVIICSKHWEEGEFEHYVESGECQSESSAWGEKFPLGSFDEKEKIKLFADYISEGSRIPKYWEENTGKTSGAHWSQSVLLTLTGQLGYTRKEALHCPLSQALADYFKHAENQGLIRLMTDDEIAMIEAAEKKEAANANA